MKKHKWFAALAAMLMALAVAGCSNPSSGTGNSGVSIPKGFVKVKSGKVTG